MNNEDCADGATGDLQASVMANSPDHGQSGVAPEHAPEAAVSGSALTGARGELLALNHQVGEASAALAKCNAPVERLRQLIADAERAEQDLGARRCRYEAELGDWIAAGCRSDRPPLPPELVAAERELGQLQSDRAAKNRPAKDC
jgi:hypothetical protein